MLHYIETELQTHYKNIKINKKKQWKEGDLCIAQYHQDQKWYRGRVIKTSGNTVQVRNNNLSFLTIQSFFIFNQSLFKKIIFELSFVDRLLYF